MRSSDFLRRSAAARQPRGIRGKIWALLGPGLITGVADDDPAGIVTDIQAGAQFRYQLAWTALLQFPLLAAVQFMVARIGLLTGHDLARVLKDHYPRWVVSGACLLLLAANLFTAGADLAGVGAAIELVTRIPLRWSAAVLAIVMAVLMVFGSYQRIVSTMRWLTLAVFGYVASAILSSPNWLEVLRNTVAPHPRFTTDYLMMVVAVFGGTISPYMMVWQSAQEVEELRQAHKKPLDKRPWAVRKEVGRMMRDTLFGMGVSQLIEYFIFIAAGCVIFPLGLRHIETARQAAMALRPVGGGAGEILFAVGIIGTGLIAIPTLTGSVAYALAAATGWPSGISKQPRRAAAFNAVIVTGILIAGVIAMFGESAMKLLVASQVLNGLLAPPLLVLILLVANNHKVVGEQTNGWITNTLGALAALLMTCAAIALMVSWFAG